MEINKQTALETLERWRDLLDPQKTTKAYRKSPEGKQALTEAYKELVTALGLSNTELARAIEVDRATTDRWRIAKSIPLPSHLAAIEGYINGTDPRPLMRPTRLTVEGVLLDQRYDNLWVAIRKFREEGTEPTPNQVAHVAAFIERAKEEVGIELIIQLLQLERE